jgi:hypothetical protein
MNIALRQKLILALLIMSIQPTFAAQDKTKLDAALEKVTNYLAQKKPDWKHEAVEPIQGSRNVSVNNWALEGRIVRVSIMGYRSDDEAIAAMRRFAAEERTLDRLPDLCDGGYSWGMGGSNIAFRKGDVTIWVSNSVTNLRQGVALTKEFATLIAEALCPN